MFIFLGLGLSVNFVFWLCIHTMYEIKDWYCSYILDHRNNSLVNSIGDEICAFLGFFIGYYIFGKYIYY